MQNFVFSKIMILLSCVIASRALALDAEVLQLVEEALRANPTLEAKRAQIEAIATAAEGAGVWNDPLFSVEYMNAPTDSLRIDRSSMSGVQLKLEQNFPELGWSKTSRELAALEVSATRYATTEAERQLRQGVETLYWRLALSRALRDVTDQHRQRAEDLLSAVSSRYETGVIGQNSVSRLLVLRDRLQEDLADFEQLELEITAALVRALARPAPSRFETPRVFEPLAPGAAAEAWLAQALENRAELQRLREEIKIEQKAQELARIEARPDVDLWLAYQIREVDMAMDDGTDFISAGISIPIPLGSRKRELAQAASRRAGERSARARFAAQVDEITSELRMAEARWSRAYQKSRAYRERLLPAAEMTLQATLADFAVDRADFMALYEAQVELLELQKAYLQAVVETHLQRALVCALTGASDLPPAASHSDEKQSSAIGARASVGLDPITPQSDLAALPSAVRGGKP